MLHSALLILSGNTVNSALGLARSLILARIIPVADFGIASTLMLALTIIDMASAFGISQQIVQSKDGDDPRFIAALQGFVLVRGITSSVLVFAVAGPLADFLNVPEAAWGYRMMALVPLLGAMGNLDATRLSRHMVFWPGILAGLLSNLLSLAALWPLGLLFGDWRVMLGVILIGSTFGMIASHVIARRPYRVAFDRARTFATLKFGWPILVNGALLFLVFNGDRLIVGRELGMAVLGIFAMGMTLTLTPTLVMAGSAQSFFLPQLSSAAPDRFARLASAVFQVHFLFAGFLVVCVVLLAPPFIHIVLGPKYADLVPIVAWLAILQGLRIFKGGPSMVAVARAKTENAMIANLVRIAAVPVAWWVAVRTGEVLPVIAVGIVGEALGAVVAFFLVRWRVRLGLRDLVVPVTLTLATMAAGGLHAWAMARPGGGLPAPAWLAGLMVVMFVASLLSMKPLWTFVLGQLRRRP